MDRLLSVTTVGECGVTTNSSERDSLNPLGTKGTEVNSTQSQPRKRGQYKRDSKESRRIAALKGIKGKTEEAISKSLLNLKSEKKFCSKKTKSERSAIAKKRSLNVLLSGKEEERRKKISISMKGKVKTKEHLEKIAEAKKEWTEEKRSKIFKNAERNRKISEGRKKFLENNETFKEKMIERFINAPKYNKLPNKPEVNVINLGVKDLKYTGNGTYFITLSTNKKKNPDFVIMGSKRAKGVVELMDFKYWHNRNEIEDLTKLYAEKKVKCLIIDAVRCYQTQDLLQVKNEIETFVSGLE